MTFTHEETEAVTQKIRTMAAEYGLALSGPLPFQTREEFYSAPFTGSLSEEKRIVQFVVFTQLFDSTRHPVAVTFTGSVESKVIRAGTAPLRVVVQVPEALKTRQKVKH